MRSRRERSTAHRCAVGVARGAQLSGDRGVAQQARAIIAERLEVVGAADSGAINMKMRSTGRPSGASKSIARSSRAKTPKICSHLASLPCGMATPSPTPVEPSRSRWRIASKISRDCRPETERRALAHFLERLLLAIHPKERAMTASGLRSCDSDIYVLRFPRARHLSKFGARS